MGWGSPGYPQSQPATWGEHLWVGAEGIFLGTSRVSLIAVGVAPLSWKAGADPLFFIPKADQERCRENFLTR